MSWDTEYSDVIEAIETRLTTVLTAVGAAVVLGEVPDGRDFPRTADGVLKPTAVLEFSSPEDVPAFQQGICGVADQMGIFNGTALCISESSKNTIRLVGMVANTLRGFRPASGCSEIHIFGSVVRTPVTGLMHPARFAQPLGFGLSIGAVVVP